MYNTLLPNTHEALSLKLDKEEASQEWDDIKRA